MRVIQSIIFLIGLVTLGITIAYSEESSKTTEPSKNKTANSAKSADTYNFYFQKAPGTQKVRQGEEQSIEPSDEIATKAAPQQKQKEKKRGLGADLFAGLALIPGQSGVGINIGAHGRMAGGLGLRLSIFAASGKRSNGNSSLSASGISETSSRTSFYGSDFTMSYDLIQTEKFRLAPLLGALFMFSNSTTQTHNFSAFGSDDSSTSNSKFSINPCLGLSGTLYFSDQLGINLTFLIPTTPKNSMLSANVVIGI